MVDILERTEVGELELLLEFTGELDAGSVGQFLEALSDCAAISKVLRGGTIHIVDTAIGSIRIKFIAKIAGVAAALSAVGATFAGKPVLSTVANASQIAQFAMEVREKIFGKEVEEFPHIRKAACRLVLKNPDGRLSLAVEGEECLKLSQAVAREIMHRERELDRSELRLRMPEGTIQPFEGVGRFFYVGYKAYFQPVGYNGEAWEVDSTEIHRRLAVGSIMKVSGQITDLGDDRIIKISEIGPPPFMEII